MERIDVVDRLLAAGANVNKKDKKDKSVLLYAIDSGMLCILDRLIAFGADYQSLNWRRTHLPDDCPA